MARPLRIEFPGALYHLTARGNRRQAIFRDDADRTAFVDLLGAVCRRFGWRVQAWCLMPNHYHLVAATPEANLSRGMRQLAGVYTQRFNRRHDQIGHLFQGRYKAILVERESHLLELSRYVVLNPVRAGLAPDADAWRWSSYRATVGAAAAPAWLDRAGLLERFAGGGGAAARAYADFVRDGVGAASPWQALRHQVFLGDDAFIAHASRAYATTASDEIPKAQRRALMEPLAAYRRRYADRDTGMARAYLTGVYTMKQIGEAYGVHSMTVSRAVKKFESEGGDVGM